MKQQSLARALKDLNGTEEVVQQVHFSPAPHPLCHSETHPLMPAQEPPGDDDSRLPPLPMIDLGADFIFDCDLLRARRDLFESEKPMPWEDIRTHLLDECWNLATILGSDDAAVQRWLLQKRCERLQKHVYWVARAAMVLLPSQESSAVAVGLRRCVSCDVGSDRA